MLGDAAVTDQSPNAPMNPAWIALSVLPALVAEVERLRKVEAAARHLIDMIGRTGGVIPV